jgi:hypothetical protein
MNVTGRWSSTMYQATNYGLGGLCETHIDPIGYLDTKFEVPEDRTDLVPRNSKYYQTLCSIETIIF